MKKICLAFLTLAFLWWPSQSLARSASEITDWYLKDYQSQIIVNPDSSLAVTEKIIADCGDLPDKHGIFRVLPLFYQPALGQKVKTPLSQIQVADFNGQPLPYQKSWSGNLLTLKIGDADQTVQGENDYQISYLVKNAIRFDQPQFDELYWNLNGNYWQIDIDHYRSEIVLPQQLNQNNTELQIYTGSLYEKNTFPVDYYWNNNLLVIESKATLAPGQGLTLSLTFPKNIFTPYQPTFWETYDNYLYCLLPFFTLLLAGWLWWRYGRDPHLGKTVIAEYEPPTDLTPLTAGIIMSNGFNNKNFITASLIDLAAKGFVTIEETGETFLLKQKNYQFAFTGKDFSLLKLHEQKILSALFGDGLTAGQKASVDTAQLKKDRQLAQHWQASAKAGKDWLIENNYFQRSGFYLRLVFLIVGGLMLWPVIFLIAGSPWPGLGWALLTSAVIIIAFGIVMVRLTPAGAEARWKISGLELYIKTAEKYRQQFYEKENIFEKLLPYAILFGLTKLWLKKMETIYGQEYLASHWPAWYVATGGTFDPNFDSLTSAINAVNSAVNSVASASGANGGGFSGGGGGGGGGGGW